MKPLFASSAFLGLVAGPLMALGPATAQQGKLRVVGYLENAVIVAAGLPMKARTTSIHAINIERFRRDGRWWVRFTVAVGDRKVTFERRIFRISRIRRTRVGVVERVVVKLGICLAGFYKLAQVNLTDRSNMNYPLLVGRRFMQSGGLAIASGREFVGKPVCRKVSEAN
jgi:hypothetical protein